MERAHSRTGGNVMKSGTYKKSRYNWGADKEDGNGNVVEKRYKNDGKWELAAESAAEMLRKSSIEEAIKIANEGEEGKNGGKGRSKGKGKKGKGEKGEKGGNKGEFAMDTSDPLVKQMQLTEVLDSRSRKQLLLWFRKDEFDIHRKNAIDWMMDSWNEKAKHWKATENELKHARYRDEVKRAVFTALMEANNMTNNEVIESIAMKESDDEERKEERESACETDEEVRKVRWAEFKRMVGALNWRKEDGPIVIFGNGDLKTQQFLDNVSKLSWFRKTCGITLDSVRGYKAIRPTNQIKEQNAAWSREKSARYNALQEIKKTKPNEYIPWEEIEKERNKRSRDDDGADGSVRDSMSKKRQNA